MRIRTRAALAALPVALTLALAGCGSDGGGDDGVASAGDGRKDPKAAASPGLSRDEMLVKLAQCLREHGVDVEDPKPGEGLAVPVDGGGQAKVDTAMEACRAFEPPAPSDEDNAKEREQMLTFARCMRENGVESFKDPKPGEGVDLGPEQAQDPDLKAAEKKCGGTGDTKSSTVGQ
ncbi:hypothetical protein ACFQLX_20530 [Streptomyces polyrhachis]|uniref:Secreted protein n=1 Tax=Streptomyces polyrhachis TaxID=1282885 RepID=A0ABW2GKN5_9ACTN